MIREGLELGDASLIGQDEWPVSVIYMAISVVSRCNTRRLKAVECSSIIEGFLTSTASHIGTRRATPHSSDTENEPAREDGDTGAQGSQRSSFLGEEHLDFAKDDACLVVAIRRRV